MFKDFDFNKVRGEEKNTVENDRWDRRFVNHMLDGVDDFLINHEALTTKVPTGSPAWSDLFWLLWKYDPQLVDETDMAADHLINYFVSHEMQDVNEFKKLKIHCEGDDVASALACIDLRPTLEQLFDKAEKLKSKIEEAIQLAQQMAQAVTEKELEALQAQMNALEAEIQKAETEASVQVKQDLSEASEEALKNVKDLANSYSLTGDDVWKRASFPERMEMAKKLMGPKMRELLDAVGPLKRVMSQMAHRRPSPNARDQVYRISMDNDINRLVPHELLKLCHPLLKRDFLQKFVNKELMVMDFKGDDKIGRGGLIALVDTSGSMRGMKENVAKAVALCALTLARQQRRSFYGILFSSSIMEFDFTVPDKQIPDEIVRFAETFQGQSTNFEAPLEAALGRLRDEHAKKGRVEGDILFITDGHSSLPPGWVEEFNEEKERLQFKVWSVLIGTTPTPVLEQISDQIVSIEDVADPNSFEQVFRSLGR